MKKKDNKGGDHVNAKRRKQATAEMISMNRHWAVTKNHDGNMTLIDQKGAFLERSRPFWLQPTEVHTLCKRDSKPTPCGEILRGERKPVRGPAKVICNPITGPILSCKRSATEVDQV